MKNNSTLNNNAKVFGLQVNSVAQAILWSGLIAGALDAAAGVVVYYLYFAMNPFQVLQYIASGIFGPTAIGGSFLLVIVGLVLHFIIAYTVSIIYYIAYPKIKLLSDYKVLMGLIYGLGIWVVMNLLVLPNSNIPKSPFDFGLAIIGIVWHMLLVGLPIALIIGKHFEIKK